MYERAAVQRSLAEEPFFGDETICFVAARGDARSGPITDAEQSRTKAPFKNRQRKYAQRITSCCNDLVPRAACRAARTTVSLYDAAGDTLLFDKRLYVGMQLYGCAFVLRRIVPKLPTITAVLGSAKDIPVWATEAPVGVCVHV